MKERLIPVRSESEIRIGAIYVVRNCRICGKRERFMITGHAGLRMFSNDGIEHFIAPAHAVAPVDCQGDDYSNLALAVAQGRLFRVDDGLTEESNPYTVSKPKEKTR